MRRPLPTALAALAAALLAGCADHTPTDPEPEVAAPTVRDVAYTAAVLPGLGGDDAYANAINASGVAVGWARTADGRRRPVAWRGGAVAALAAEDTAGGEAFVVNANGDAGGSAGGRARVWLADGRALTPDFPVASSASPGAVTYTCCARIQQLTKDLRALAVTLPVYDTAHPERSVAPPATVLADLRASTASFLGVNYGVDGLRSLNNAGHAVGSRLEFESQYPIYLGVQAPSDFPALPAGAPSRSPSSGHSFSALYFIDDADRMYGAVDGATYMGPSGGRAVWLYPFLDTHNLSAVSGGGLLLATRVATGCTTGGVGCVDRDAVLLWRASDQATFRVVAPTGWTFDALVSLNDAGQIVGHGAGPDGRRGAVVLTPSSALPTP